MALRNTLLVCAAIIGAGGIAGLSMRPAPYGYRQPYSNPDYYAGQPTPPTAPIAPPSSPEVPGTSDAQTVALSQIDQADRLLPRMPVESSNGERIGEVASVMMDGSGHAREVVLTQGSRLRADELVYLPARSVLVAQAPVGPQPPNTSNGYGPPQPPPNGYGPPRGDGYGPPDRPPPGPGPDRRPPDDHRRS